MLVYGVILVYFGGAAKSADRTICTYVFVDSDCVEPKNGCKLLQNQKEHHLSDPMFVKSRGVLGERIKWMQQEPNCRKNIMTYHTYLQIHNSNNKIYTIIQVYAHPCSI